MPEFNPNQLVRFNEAGQLVDVETGELWVTPAPPRRVCANTLVFFEKAHNGGTPKVPQSRKARRKAGGKR